jgi:hypothetical protein
VKAPPPPRPPVTVAPPPPPPVRRKPSGAWATVKLLFWLGIIAAGISYRYFKKYNQDRVAAETRDALEFGHKVEVRKKLEERAKADKASSGEKDLLEKLRLSEWTDTKASILKLDAEGKYAEALKECEAYVQKAGATAPAEAVELRKSLKAWNAAYTQAEQMRKYNADQRAGELLDKAGESRGDVVKAIKARWCEEDWVKTKAALDKAVADDNPYTAQLEIDRFLKKPHQGGRHRKDAEARALSFQADIEYAELRDRVDTLKARTPADAVTALETWLAKPHQGGTHREEALKEIAQLKDEAKLVLFSARLSVSRLAASPSGKFTAFTSDGVRILDTATREELWSPVKSLVRSLAFGGEDRLMTGIASKVTVWDIPARKELRSFSPPSNVYIVALAMKPDGKTVIGAMSDSTLMTWDSSRDDPPAFAKEATFGAITIALNNDGTHVAVASRDKSMRVRELVSGKELKWAGPPVTVSALALSPDGRRVLAGSSNGMITVWTAETGEAGPSVTGHTGGNVTCAAWSPDGAILATGGADSQIRLSSAKDGSTIKVLTGHRGRISSIAFVPGGLLSSSSDGSVRTWPLK